MPKPVYQFKDFAIEHYGEPIFRVPLDLGLGCPHRGSEQGGGCTFCPEDGARAVQLANTVALRDQIEVSVAFARRRYHAKRFMAYFQTYTNTWAPIDEQARFYERLFDIFPFDAVSVGTRPDCLPEAVLDLLAELNRKVDVWLDLGVQTAREATLARINRGHGWQASRRAIEAAHSRGLRPVAHLIVGLPGEGADDFNATAEKVAELPVAGIKIHNLHIIKDTSLAEDYKRQPFPVMNEYEYSDCLMEMLRRLPSTLPIMRMVTDTPRKRLLAPHWTMTKGEFEAHLMRQMILREHAQGDLCDQSTESVPLESVFTPIATADGSLTFWSKDFNEHYHSRVGAVTEAQKKYIQPTWLQDRLHHGDVHLLDICFGLGYNTLCACEAAMRSSTESRLFITALEMDRRAVRQAINAAAIQSDSQLDWSIILEGLYRADGYENERLQIEMIWGDARHSVCGLPEHKYDVVFLDPFSTQRNSELWTLDFFRRIRRVMKSRSAMATYCAALPVRGGLLKAGFHIGESIPVGRKRSGTIAAIDADDIEHPIAPEEMRKLKETTRGLPYRDPHGCWNNGRILRHRELVRKRILSRRDRELGHGSESL